MKYQKNITFRSLNDGFSLVEMVITISVVSLLMTAVLSGAFFLNKGFNRAKDNSKQIFEISKMCEQVSLNALNTDIHPHHAASEFELAESSITFYAKGGKIKYDFSENKFNITENNRVQSYDCVKNFKIKYFDNESFELFNYDEFPYYCELYFTMFDNTELTLEMRL
jgi:prepilin-type N-terminal cleavage/methylation domain-containing protein